MNLKIKLIKHKWVLFCLIGASMVGVLSYSLPIAQGDDILYLLSSISQGLAALFALVFTITIFGAQMMRKFTAMDKMIDKWTKILMIIFAIGIILPLMQLETNYDFLNDLLHLNFDKTENLSLAIDLFIATLCVLAIIPYLMKINSIMKYEGGVSKLNEEASEAIDSDHKVTASNRISELAELCMSAVENMPESKASNIVNTIKVLGNSVADKGWNAATFETLTKLEKIGLKCTEKKLDGRSPEEYGLMASGQLFSATEKVLEAIREVGVKAADKKLEKVSGFPVVELAITGLYKIGLQAIDSDLSDSTVFESCYGLLEIGKKVAEKKIGHYGNQTGLLFISSSEIISEDNFRDESYVIVNLKRIAYRAYEKDQAKFKNTCEICMEYLWVLGVFVKKYLPEYAADLATTLKKSENQVFRDLFANENIREGAKKYIKNEYPQLEGELKAFEELYDASK